MTKATSPLSEQAANEITDMIVNQRRFRPGDKLPNEMELAEELGISRITLREAIRVLCTQGLVEIQRGRGTFVLSSRPAIQAGTGISVLELTESSQRDILELRMALEPVAAYYAAKRASEDELREIDDLCRRMEELAGQRQPFFREAADFHNAIAAASHNTLLCQTLEIVNRTVYAASLQESAAISLQDCRELVRYLKDRNAGGVREIMRASLVRVWQGTGMTLE